MEQGGHFPGHINCGVWSGRPPLSGHFDPVLSGWRHVHPKMPGFKFLGVLCAQRRLEALSLEGGLRGMISGEGVWRGGKRGENYRSHKLSISLEFAHALQESSQAQPAYYMYSVLDLAKVLRLQRNLYSSLRKCCACHDICESVAPATKSVFELAKVLRLPRHLRKCCARHEICT